MAASAAALSIRAFEAHGSPQDGLRCSAGPMAARTTTRLGRRPARRTRDAQPRLLRSDTDQTEMDRKSPRRSVLAIRTLVHPYVPSLATGPYSVTAFVFLARAVVVLALSSA